MMGIFSDMETGTVVLIVAVIALFAFFGAKNLFRDDGKGGRGKKGGGGGTAE